MPAGRAGHRHHVATARIGCSGWSYRDWRGVVYPPDAPSRTWFAHYAERFDTVELNSTFYRLPSAPTVRHWAEQAPPAFVYAAKVAQFATHRKKLRDPEGWMARHVERLGLLGSTGGPNLLQLPPHWHRDAARLDAALAAAPTAGWRWAVELRDPTWLHDDVFEVLTRHRAALCVHDLLPDHPWVRTAPWVYVRFHGPDALSHAYVGRYGGTRLEDAATRLAAWLDEGHDVYAYFNNDTGGAAVEDAAWLRRRLTGA